MKQYAVADHLTGQEIARFRKKINLTQAEFAAFTNVSQKTVERWESNKSDVRGPMVTLLRILRDNPELIPSLEIPEKKFPMRLWYMFRDEICAVIDVDERIRTISIHNFTKDFLKRPFGKIETPDFEQYEEFLESRCFPRQRDKMKIILKELDLPFYDPLLIIEKTEGRMAEDEFWIKIER